MQDYKQTKPRLLFVCRGNTCRSPMAEGIAKNLLQRTEGIKSAGIAPFTDGAALEAIEVMHSFGIEISDHQTQDVADISLEDFDYVITMEPRVFEHLLNHHSGVKSKLIAWNITDPYGQELDVYRECANEIQEHMHNLVTTLADELEEAP